METRKLSRSLMTSLGKIWLANLVVLGVFDWLISGDMLIDNLVLETVTSRLVFGLVFYGFGSFVVIFATSFVLLFSLL